jgi:hypothetical protein
VPGLAMPLIGSWCWRSTGRLETGKFNAVDLTPLDAPRLSSYFSGLADAVRKTGR